MPVKSLPIIRVALLSGVLLFGLAAFTIGPQMQDADASNLFGVMRLVFAGMAIAVLLGLKVMQAKVAAADQSSAATLTLVAWALAEGTALLGAIILLLTGVIWPFLAGVGVMLASFVLFPIPAAD